LLGSLEHLLTYETERQRVVVPMMAGVDSLNRIYSNRNPLLVMLRTMGCSSLQSLAPVKVCIFIVIHHLLNCCTCFQRLIGVRNDFQTYSSRDCIHFPSQCNYVTFELSRHRGYADVESWDNHDTNCRTYAITICVYDHMFVAQILQFNNALIRFWHWFFDAVLIFCA
jgi:hypothetical protein